MGKKLSLLILVLAVLFSSCVRSTDVTIRKVESIRMEGLSGVVLRLQVENRSGSRIKLNSAKFALVDERGRSVADFILSERVVIPRKFDGTLTIPIRMKVNNPLSALSIAGNFPASLRGYRLEGGGEVKAGMARKKLNKLSIPLSDIIDNFSDDMTKIINEVAL